MIHQFALILLFFFVISQPSHGALKIIINNKSQLEQKLEDWEKDLKNQIQPSTLKIELIEKLKVSLHSEDLKVDETGWILKTLRTVQAQDSSGESALRKNNGLLAEKAMDLFKIPVEPGESALDILKSYVNKSDPEKPDDPALQMKDRAYVAGSRWESVNNTNEDDDDIDFGEDIDKRLIELDLGLIKSSQSSM